MAPRWIGGASVAEVTHSGKDHGEAEAVGGGDDVSVADGAAGLDDGGGAGLGDDLKTIGKREEGIGSGDASGERKHGFHGAEAGRIDARHLAGADAEGLAVAGVDDGVGLDVLADFPGKEERGELVGSGPALRDGFDVSGRNASEVGILEQQAAGNLLQHALVGSRANDDEAEILFCGEALARLGSEAGSGDGFDKERGHFFGGIAVDFAIDADDRSEGGDGIGDQGFAVGVEDIGAGGRAAGIGVLDDGDHGLVEFLTEGPAGVEVDEVVVAELLALELLGGGDAGAGAVDVKRSALVGIFAVAERLRERVDEAQGGGEVVAEVRGGVNAGMGSGQSFEGIGDGGVVGGGGGEGALGEAPAGFERESAVMGGEFLGEGGVVGGRGDDGDIFEILGGGADHGGTANVDVLDNFSEADAGFGCGFLEGVEVDDDHIDGLDAVGGGLVAMAGIFATEEDAAMDFGMKGLDAAVEHLREAGEVGDIADGEAGVAEGLGGASGGDELDAVRGELLREGDEACFIRHAQQRPGDMFFTAQRFSPQEWEWDESADIKNCKQLRAAARICQGAERTVG